MASPTASIGTQALLFDLGGVVLDIDFNRAFEHWLPISGLTLAEIKTAFQFDLPYQQHERGEISADAYFAHLRRVLRLQGDETRILQGWNAIFKGEITLTRRLVEAARAHFPCYAFTNSNTAHQAAWSARFPALLQAFDTVFVSSEIGCRKPEPRAFEFIGQTLGLPLGSIMFFDDTLENVHGAVRAGLQAVHVRGSEDVRAALQGLGCVP